ncbi:MAG: hypothetical protein MUP85_01470 [Candidatus Lokiarchaeota archaeon]|nr:hypothetical protein [Candidatus Lokiarchaeota archaeon]
MGMIEELNEFNKRWDIPDSSDYAAEFEKFRTRILNSFKSIDTELQEFEVIGFCDVLGIPFHAHNYGDIYKTLKEENDEKKFYYILQVLGLLPIQNNIRKPVNIRRQIFKRIMLSIDLSKINLTYTIENNNLLLYPAGEKELDNKVVNEVLSFLNPECNTHFIDALKFYQSTNQVKSAESLRRTLEEFLRYKLDNVKGLDANISELQAKLKAGGRDPMIRNIIFQIFNYLDKYFNENSKHKDGDIDEIENEYLIYQVGLLLRYINRSL